MILGVQNLVIAASLCFPILAMASSWSVTLQQNDPMAVNESYYATSDSFAPMKNLSFPYSDARSWIGVGCNTDNQYWAFIGFNKANFTGGQWNKGTKYHFAKIKYDDRINQVYLSESSDGRKFLTVGTGDKSAFIMGLKTSNTVITGVPWYEHGDVWFKYSMNGSTNAINTVFKKCGIAPLANNELNSPTKINTLSEISLRPPKNGDWTLAIATFKTRENASRLAKKLTESDYPVYQITQGNLFKVYVGTGVLRKDAERFREKLKNEFSLNGIVVMYSDN